MEIKILSSLAKVFPDEICNGYEPDGINCLKNERTSFQLAIRPCCDTDISLCVKDFSDAISVFRVKSVPAEFTVSDDRDDYFLRDAKPGDYPDILLPADSVKAKGNEWTAFFAEFDPNGKIDAGEYYINIVINAGNEQQKVTVKAEVFDAFLPEQELFCTHWFHSDCLASYYGVEVFSGEYWRIVENFMKTAVRHGINLILTPIFTPPLDTAVGSERPTVQLVDVTVKGDKYIFGFDKLKKWVELARSCGIKYFEISHLFTQWGAKHAPKIVATKGKHTEKIFGWGTRAGGTRYAKFLRQLAPELIKFIDENGLRDVCFFHTSDEPGDKHYISYKKASDLTKELLGEFKIIDALSEYKFYADGIIKTPVTSIEKIEDFAGRVPELWTYYCCCPHKNYNPNRFNAMPSLRNRILGILMYIYDVKGFLQWGYNFYYTQYSKRLLDPFTETDAGGKFPSGDAYVVYPAKDGTALVSLRFKVFYDAIQDYTALYKLESTMKREEIIMMLERGLTKPLSVTDYPHSEEWLLKKRREINELITRHN